MKKTGSVKSSLRQGIAVSRSDRAIEIINCFVLTVVLVLVMYPLYFVLIASISDPSVMGEGVLLYPKKLNFDGYIRIFRDENIWIGYKNSIIYTVFGTLINLLFTLTGGYALSRKDLPGRRFFTLVITITMFINSGLIPRYLQINSMNMLDTIWSMVIPNAITVYNLFVTRTYFATSIPESLLEAAQLDGCSDFKFFTRIALPLSKAIVAVLVIFYGVNHWNSYFNALLYLRDSDKYPLQIFLREILVLNQLLASTTDADALAEIQRIVESVKYGVIVVSSLPMLILYPFMQKYFVTGVMLGSVKG